MAQAMEVQRKKIHPHKFTLWVAIGSMIMMFAGLTSAYIVKRSQANWVMVEIPWMFWLSTATILLSSLTMHLAMKSFKDRRMHWYRRLMVLTAILGIAFLPHEVAGFLAYRAMDIRLVGAGQNASHSFLLAIAGKHGLHVLGGVIALTVMAVKAISSRKRSYDSVPV